MENHHKHKFVGGGEKRCACGVFAKDECVNGHKYAEVGAYIIKATGSKRCPVCSKKVLKDWRANLPEDQREKVLAQQRASAKRRRDSMRKRVFDHYGWSCACCGESVPEFLTIDHVNGDGAEHRREIGPGPAASHRWIIDRGFPDTFQTLCYNCNCAKHVYGTCPHQKASK